MSILTMTDTLNAKVHTAETSLSSRLTYALKRLQISQSELARKVGVKPQVIQYLCTSNANKSKFAYEIAAALEVNAEWLVTGKGPMLFALPAEHPKVPLLLWHQVGNWLNKNKTFTVNADNFVNISSIAPPNSYALKVNDTSMIPRFEINTILVIDPSSEARPGDFVIAEIPHQDQPVVRQLLHKNGKFYLVPSNSAIYKEIELTDEVRFLGTVRQTYYEFTR